MPYLRRSLRPPSLISLSPEIDSRKVNPHRWSATLSSCEWTIERRTCMKTVSSKDGTTIAFDLSGEGPVVILVDGALQYRAFDQGMAELANLLSPHFTVIHYDRRGRGDSTDTQPYALAREIEDIESLIDEVGGSASLYGISSGAALAMEAAIALPDKVKKLAMYEAPYNHEPNARKAWQEYREQLSQLVAAGRGGD